MGDAAGLIMSFTDHFFLVLIEIAEKCHLGIQGFDSF